MTYNFSMPMDLHITPFTDADAPSGAHLADLVARQEREIVNLRRQVAWFQRQIFGQKSEKRPPLPDGVQGVLGIGFDPVPGALDKCGFFEIGVRQDDGARAYQLRPGMVAEHQ